MPGAAGSTGDPFQLNYFSGYFDAAAVISTPTFSATTSLATFTAISIGQSLHGNNSSGSYSVVNLQNLNFCYNNGWLGTTASRMFGCGDSFQQTNFLARLGDKVITAGSKQRWIGCPMAIDGSVIAQHAEGGVYNHHIGVMARRLADKGIVPDAVMIGIGESDALAGTSAVVFAAGLTSVINTFRAAGVTCPVYIEKCAWINGSIPAGGAAIRAGVDAVVNGTTVKAGPDTDTLDNTNRQDTTHWNATGADAAAGLWKTVLGL